MVTLHKHARLALALSAALLVSTPALAQDWRDNRGWASSEGQYQAYDRGYRKGLDQGRDDAKDRRASDYRRDKDYRKADDGYKDRYGPREWYANEFRRGYVAGYTRGYNEYARGYYGNDRYYGGGRYDDDRYYRGGRAIPRGGTSVVNGAFNRGYNDGIQKGQEDARRGRSYEPSRHGWYRSGDRGYHREFGPRWQYETSYRDGFMRGYSEAYRGRLGYRSW